MKKLSLLILSMLTLPVYAQDIMQALLEHQPTRRGTSQVRTTTTAPEVGATAARSTITGKSCQELKVNEQRSLPLKVITRLIQDEPQKINITHDPRSGTLKISSKDMISNCSSMLEWKVNQTMINGENAYTVEAKFKDGAECKEGKCNYQVAKVEEGSFQKFETMSLAPNLKGFKHCLAQSGVFKAGSSEAEKKAIYYAPINEKAADIKDTGKLLFVSEGPESVQIGALHGEFGVVNDCKYYEVISPDQKLLMSNVDEDRARLRKEAQQLEACTVNEYHKVADFIDTYTEFEDQLKDVRNKLIKEAAVKSAESVLEGKGTDEDMKILADFNKYIVEPKIDQAVALYDQLADLKGEERTKKLAELNVVLAELKAMSEKPYFSQAHTDKMLALGKFDDAKDINETRLNIVLFGKLGTKDANNVEQSTSVIEKKIANSKIDFSDSVEKIREKYEIRTGQSTGMAKMNFELASRMRRNIQVRTQNYTEEIQDEYKRMQPGGYCYAYFRNTQKCMQQSMERIQELQFVLARNNKVDSERAAEYDQKAAEYKTMEDEGRRYVASQGGEVATETADDDLSPAARSDSSSYSFNYNPAQGGQQPGMQPGIQQGYWPQAQGPGMYNPVNPYGNQGMGMYGMQNPYSYQQPSMGQGGAFGQFGFQANMGMNPFMGMQQPGMGGGYQMYGQQQPMGQPYGQSQGYWNQPYSAMNNYSMYR